MATFTQASAARTATRQSTSIDAGGNVQITLAIIDATGLPLETRTINIPADGTAITDTLGKQIAASVPAALANAITVFTAQLDAAIAVAATGSKLSR